MSHIGFGVLNTDKMTLVKLGQHGPHVSERDRAEGRALGESHLQVVEVRGDDGCDA